MYKLYRDLGRCRLVCGNPREDKDFAVYTFNANGWLVGWRRRGLTYRCGLDGSAMCTRCAEAGGQRFLRTVKLSASELKNECVLAAEALEAWRGSADYAELLPRLLGETPLQVAEKFKSVWQRVAILPPDQYASAVVRLTQGCAYNRCRFCSFYKDVPYLVHGVEEFDAHLNKVEEFFGSELEERRGIFLADANAANADDEVLISALEVLGRRAAETPVWGKCLAGGTASFLDTFSCRGRSAEQWRRLRGAGLSSLYLGVESGSEPLRRWWKKPGTGREITALAETLKGAGINLGVIVLSGAEPEFIDNGHNEATARLLNDLPLNNRDKIYISEYQPAREWPDDAAYVEYRGACRRRTEELQAGLRFAAYPKGPVVSLYDVWQFAYI